MKRTLRLFGDSLLMLMLFGILVLPISTLGLTSLMASQATHQIAYLPSKSVPVSNANVLGNETVREVQESTESSQSSISAASTVRANPKVGSNKLPLKH